MARALACIHEMPQRALDLEELAREAGVSRATFIRPFQCGGRRVTARLLDALANGNRRAAARIRPISASVRSPHAVGYEIGVFFLQSRVQARSRRGPCSVQQTPRLGCQEEVGESMSGEARAFVRACSLFDRRVRSSRRFERGTARRPVRRSRLRADSVRRDIPMLLTDRVASRILDARRSLSSCSSASMSDGSTYTPSVALTRCSLPISTNSNEASTPRLFSLVGNQIGHRRIWSAACSSRSRCSRESAGPLIVPVEVLRLEIESEASARRGFMTSPIARATSCDYRSEHRFALGVALSCVNRSSSQPPSCGACLRTRVSLERESRPLPSLSPPT